jgi:hypothetical protein
VEKTKSIEPKTNEEIKQLLKAALEIYPEYGFTEIKNDPDFQYLFVMFEDEMHFFISEDEKERDIPKSIANVMHLFKNKEEKFRSLHAFLWERICSLNSSPPYDTCSEREYRFYIIEKEKRFLSEILKAVRFHLEEDIDYVWSDLYQSEREAIAKKYGELSNEYNIFLYLQVNRVSAAHCIDTLNKFLKMPPDLFEVWKIVLEIEHRLFRHVLLSEKAEFEKLKNLRDKLYTAYEYFYNALKNKDADEAEKNKWIFEDQIIRALDEKKKAEEEKKTRSIKQ